MIFLTKSIRTMAVIAAAAAMPFAATALSAQEAESDPGLAVYNESMHELRVYAFDEDAEDRVLLGWIGADELEYFAVPRDARNAAGEYHVAVQQVTPLPQLGVPADPHPLLTSPMMDPEPWETVRVVVEEDMDLSHVMVR